MERSETPPNKNQLLPPPTKIRFYSPYTSYPWATPSPKSFNPPPLKQGAILHQETLVGYPLSVNQVPMLCNILVQHSCLILVKRAARRCPGYNCKVSTTNDYKFMITTHSHIWKVSTAFINIIDFELDQFRPVGELEFIGANQSQHHHHHIPLSPNLNPNTYSPQYTLLSGHIVMSLPAPLHTPDLPAHSHLGSVLSFPNLPSLFRGCVAGHLPGKHR